MQSHVDNKFPSLGGLGAFRAGSDLVQTLGQKVPEKVWERPVWVNGVLEKVLDEVLVQSQGPTKLDETSCSNNRLLHRPASTQVTFLTNQPLRKMPLH